MPSAFADAVRAAGRALEVAGYEVVEATPPDLDLITTVWRVLMHFGLVDDLPILRRFITPALAVVLEQTIAAPAMSVAAAFVERRRLQREWSTFFARALGRGRPDLVRGAVPARRRPRPGDRTGHRCSAGSPSSSPATCWASPPPRCPPVSATDGLPLGVQVYADLWRDDLSLAAAQVVEDAFGTITPIDPP